MTTLTHKVRNPKKLDTWLDIWTADNITVNNDTVNYTITPSNKWKIPIAQLSKTNNDVIPIDYINNGKNIVTTTNPENTTGGLAYFNSHNVVKAINADRGLSLETKDNKTTIGHENNLIIGTTIGPTSSNEPSNSTEGTSVYIPFFTYDNYGHITEGNNITYTVKDLTIKNLSNEFTPATGEGQNATPGKNFNKTVVDIIGNSINNLLPINSADNNGIVLAGNNNESSIWATASVTENNQTKNEPAWRKITADMFDSSTEINANNLPKNSSNDGKAGIIDKAPTKTGTSTIKSNMVWGTDSDESDNNNKPGWMSLINKKFAITVHYDEKNKTLSIGNSTNLWENYSIAEVYDSTETYYVKTPSGPLAGSYVTQDVSSETDFNNQKGNLYYRDYNWFFILSTDSKVELERVTE